MLRPTRTLRQAVHAVARTPHPSLTLSAAVRSALAASTKTPLVALESTIITHGLPYPYNLEVARELEQTVIDQGAVPATIALLDGKALVGLDSQQLERLARCAVDQSKNDAIKASRRDIAHVLAKGSDTVGGTTVSGTMVLAHMAGIKIFATGGIGGVHRGAESTMDISADLSELGRTPVAVFCSGPKSILDIPRTLEVLETFGVSVTTFNPSGEFPAFYTSNSGLHVPYAGDDTQAAKSILVNAELGLQSGQVFANPIPTQFDRIGAKIQQCVEQAVRESIEQGIDRRGKEVTPWLLKRLAELIPESKQSNRALVVNNAKKAAQVAVELDKMEKEVERAVDTHALGGIPSTESSKRARILFFGAAAVDITSQTRSSGSGELAATTYPGHVSVTLGGVARNMAEAATRILAVSARSSVKLISPHGDDDFGLLLRTGMQQAGMRTDGLFVPQNPGRAKRTAVCSLMLNDQGDLISGVADMDIGHTALYPQTSADPDPNALLSLLAAESPAIVVFDGNIGATQADELLAACETYSARTAIPRGRRLLTLFEPTSVSKSAIVLDHFSLAKRNEQPTQPISFATPNVVELEHMFAASRRLGLVSSPPLDDSSYTTSVNPSIVDPATILQAKALVDAGIISIILLKIGRHGVVTVDAEGARHHPVSAGKVHMVNTTGCGDSFAGAFAATLSHFIEDRWPQSQAEWSIHIDTAVEIGQRAARSTLASTKAVGEDMHLLLVDRV